MNEYLFFFIIFFIKNLFFYFFTGIGNMQWYLVILIFFALYVCVMRIIAKKKINAWQYTILGTV